MYDNEERYYDYTTYEPDSEVFQANTVAEPAKGKKKKEKKSGGFFRKAITCICLGVLFGAFAGGGFYVVCNSTDLLEQYQKVSEKVNSNSVETQIGTTQQGIQLNNTEDIRAVESDVSGVVEEVMPAMVSIINNYTTTSSFFGQTYMEENESSGSGIIVAENDEELLIVTNYHVAADATKLEITFVDGEVAEARVKGVDSEMDLAVLAVSLEDLSDETKEAIAIATLGDSDALKLGEPVIAIGNALGYGQSVTNGIVSALNREITMSDGTKGIFIQTNAAINPGNSGGALLNIKGEVIGINSNKIGGTAIEGMGYAIPISSASPIIADLMERQTRKDQVPAEEAGYIGVKLQEVPEEISQTYNMPRGVFVYSLEEGCAAEKAGIMPGDIITKLEGEKVKSYEDLQGVLKYYAAGDTVKITVMRQENGEYVAYEFDMKLGKRPPE